MSFRIAGTAFAVLGLGAALVAARYWWRASRTRRVTGFLNREFGPVLAIVFTLCLLMWALSTQARAENGQYKIRPLDLNNPADQEMLIRMLDPNGTADRDELIRTAIDLDKRFKETNRDLAAAGLQPVDYTTPNNIHFADYGVKRTKVHYRFRTRRECEKARTVAQGHGLNAEECSQVPLPPPASNIK
jgi:hypothetical protein